MTQTGFYPDPPSHRMALDADGTQIFIVSGGFSFVKELTIGEIANINSEDNATTANHTNAGPNYICFVFPELRTVTNYYNQITRTNQVGGDATCGPIETSVNTTNGIDGNWTQVATTWFHNENGNEGMPGMRTNLVAIGGNTANIKSIRFKTGYGVNGDILIYTFHLWGTRSAGQTPHRIDFTNSAGTPLDNDFDFGDQARATSRKWDTVNFWNQTSPLYIKNQSPTKQAQTITLQVESNTGDMSSNLTVSTNNTTFVNQVSIPNMTAGALYGPIYIRYSPTINTAVGGVNGRLRINVGTWL